MNSRDLMKSFSELDEELIERSERIMKKQAAPLITLERTPKADESGICLVDETVNEKARPRIWRIMGAAAAVLLMAGFLLGITQIVGIGESPKLPIAPASPGENRPAEDTLGEYAFLYDTSVPEDAVLPPKQEGSNNMVMSSSHDKNRGFNELYEDAEAVCIVTIRDWLGENELYSYYNATVERTYKGELPETIVVYQAGNSSCLCENAPLFTYGDKLLLGIRRWEDRPFENAYYVVGGETTVSYVAAAEDGSAYVIDPKGIYSHYTEYNHPELHFTKYGENKALAKELFDELGKYDRVMADHLDEWFGEYYENRSAFISSWSMIPHIYSLEEIEAFFEGLEQE